MKTKISIFEDIDQMWVHTIESCIKEGNFLDSRNGGSIELLGFIARLDPAANNVLLNPHRKFSCRYAAAELLWYLSGNPSGEMIKHYAPSYRDFLEEDGIAWGAYGGRWASQSQLMHLFKLLKEKPNTRQAVISMWDPRDLQAAAESPKKDVPCTLNIQFLVREDHLHCSVTMRSNDIWLGFPYDVFCFTSLQMFLADYLGFGYGIYQHSVGSMHLYEKNKKAAITALERHKPSYAAFSHPVEGRHGLAHFTEDLARAVRCEQVMRISDPKAVQVDNPFTKGDRWYSLIEAVRP